MKFALPICALLALASAALAPLSDRLALVPERIVVGFDEPGIAERWVTVNDNVMGGRSVGGFEIDAGRLVFEGSTNTNGGGFSSVRTRSADLNLDGTDGLLYRVRGDGRTYIAALRNGTRMANHGVSYWARFETTGDWQTVRVPYENFTPTLFGEDITGRAPELRAEDLTALGFYINDGNDGPFRLEVEWIGTYRDKVDDKADNEAAQGASASTEPGAEDNDTNAHTAAHDHDTDPAHADADAQTPDARQWAASVLAIAIERGVPQFNNGNQSACADIYEVAIASVVLNPLATNGKHTSNPALPADAIALLESGLRAGRDAHTDADRAWAYRYAMDAALGVLTRDDSADEAMPLDRAARAD